jgi:hypothetical protein
MALQKHLLLYISSRSFTLVVTWKINTRRCSFHFGTKQQALELNVVNSESKYSFAVITFYLLRPHKLTNENQSQIQSV